MKRLGVDVSIQRSDRMLIYSWSYENMQLVYLMVGWFGGAHEHGRIKDYVTISKDIHIRESDPKPGIRDLICQYTEFRT